MTLMLGGKYYRVGLETQPVCITGYRHKISQLFAVVVFRDHFGREQKMSRDSFEFYYREVE